MTKPDLRPEAVIDELHEAALRIKGARAEAPLVGELAVIADLLVIVADLNSRYLAAEARVAELESGRGVVVKPLEWDDF